MQKVGPNGDGKSALGDPLREKPKEEEKVFCIVFTIVYINTP